MNLRRRQYCILNEQFTKEDYDKKVGEFLRKPFSDLIRKFADFKLKQPHVYAQCFNDDGFSGDHVFNSKNAFICYDVNEIEDCMYAANSFHSKDCMDSNYFAWSELLYDCHSGVTLYNSNFCNTCWYSQNLEYCEYVFNSHDCFGCVSRNHAQFEILNKPYQEGEYHAKVAAIKAEMKKQGIYGKNVPSMYDEFLAFEN